MELLTQTPDLSDIQGIIMRGYTHPYSCHMIFQFGTNSKPSQFIKKIYPMVQSAATWTVKPSKLLNIGLTSSGISKLKTKFQMTKFPVTFQQGPTSPSSQQSLQDNDCSAPDKWLFGNTTVPIDCIVHVYGLTQVDLDNHVTFVSEAAVSNGLTEILPINKGKDRLEQFQLEPNYIHFGYHDGIDQPDLNESIQLEPQQSYTNPANLNNFLIGYYSDQSYFQPGPTGNSNEAKFAKNGCYNAFRMLCQDQQEFDIFINQYATSIAPVIGKDLDYSKEWLAAKLVGRWRNGCPLELSAHSPNPEFENSTEFGYGDDLQGLKCPISSHSRVTNPRDTPDMMQSDTPIPRILRRGVPYGAPPKGDDYSGDRGLIGLFLCGSIAPQFELISGWMNTNNFTNNLSTQYPQPQDALLANRSVSATVQTFAIPIGSSEIIPPPTISPEPILPQFIFTKGSAYCLLPSLSALRSCFIKKPS